jgi:2,3-dihydroxybenzoate-AMP ligase/mycobactin salicyl-AMP ligase
LAVEGFREYPQAERELYNRKRWWLGLTWSDLFDKTTDLYPEKIGLVDDSGRYTFGQLREKVDRLALSFRSLDLKPKDFVFLQLPNWHEYICVFFALQKIGVITVLLIPRHGPLEISHLAGLTNPKAWILPRQYGKIDYAPLLEEVVEKHPQIRHIIQARTEGPGRFLNLESLIAQAELTPKNLKTLEALRPDPDEASIILPTGGTTGLPKASVRSHNSYIANIEYHSRAWEINGNDTLMVITPVGHSLAMHWGIGAALLNFAKLVLLDSVQAEDICEMIQREKVTAIPSVPALISRIVSLENLERYDLRSLKKICLGGAPSTPELVRAVEDKLGCTFISGFGSSEGTNTATRIGDSQEVICNTVGRPVCPYDTIKIIDPTGKEVPAGVEGELVSKGPGIFTGYFKSPEENQTIFTPDGFFRTGDLAKKDLQGNISITGRIKDIIIRGGEKVSAAEIEKLLITHSHIQDAAVVGMPDKILGERICAYVVLRKGARVFFEEIIAFLKSKGAFVLQLPERIEFVDELPMTKVGKVDKKALREDIAGKVASQ